MKGLLLKDYYSAKNSLRSLFLVAFVFIAASFFNDYVLFLYYPCILSSIAAMTLISYEEKDRWNIYAETLPCSRVQVVSCKYIVSLIFGALTAIALLFVQTAVMLYRKTFAFGQIAELALNFIPLLLLPSAFLLPPVYKFGAEKGRIAYYIIIGNFCAILGILNPSEGIPAISFTPAINLIVGIVSILLFGISWILSIKLYQKREL